MSEMPTETMLPDDESGPLRPGTEIDGYEVERQIGKGGMGEVYLVQHPQLPKKVALKILSKEHAHKQVYKDILYNEIKQLSAVQHINVNSIYSCSEFRGRPYFTMEHLKGETLSSLIRSQPLKIEVILDFAIQICEGLKATHAQMIVHKDIKPSNIIITSDLHAIILDFGISKRGTGDIKDRQNTVSGTFAYMSPEQARASKLIDNRSDLFSFGVLLYEATTGRRPFEEESITDLLSAIKTKQQVSPRDYRKQAPSALVHIIEKLLQKQPKDRYQSVDGLLIDIKMAQNELRDNVPDPSPIIKVVVLALAMIVMVFVTYAYRSELIDAVHSFINSINPNEKPSIRFVDTQQLTFADTLDIRLPLLVNDADGDTALVVETIDAPAGMVVRREVEGFEIYWSAKSSQAGSHSISVKVTDSRAGADSASAILTVTMNPPPEDTVSGPIVVIPVKPNPPRNVVAKTIGAKKVEITWTPITDGYVDIRRETLSSGRIDIVKRRGSIGKYEDSSLSPQSNYKYKLRYFVLNTNKSDWSDAVTVTTPTDTFSLKIKALDGRLSPMDGKFHEDSIEISSVAGDVPFEVYFTGRPRVIDTIVLDEDKISTITSESLYRGRPTANIQYRINSNTPLDIASTDLRFDLNDSTYNVGFDDSGRANLLTGRYILDILSAATVAEILISYPDNSTQTVALQRVLETNNRFILELNQGNALLNIRLR